MPDPIIEVQNLSKLYQLGTIGGRTLRESLQRRWYRLRGKEHLLSRVGADHKEIPLHPGQAGPRPNTMWALHDVSFTVQEGETLGIIGRNGAGKSTLLKLLARITEPTSGRAVIHGRVASLLEVGTGFHPELTGRENVYLSGATLGMKKSEISRKFEEIVAFSDIGAYLDTPVKRYSSGMYVRLAFAVAAHLEPEVLIVDEVLAVGDAAFQKKCLGKMDDAAKGGRTVLFVSHNMAAIRQLCQKCAVFEEGRLQELAPAGEVVDRYLKQANDCSATSERCFDLDIEKEFQVRSARLLDQKGTPKGDFSCDEPVVIEMICQVQKRIPGLYGYLELARTDGTPVIVSDSFDVPPNPLDELGVGSYSLAIQIPPRTLAAGEYTVYVSFTSSAGVRGWEIDSTGRMLSFRLDDHLSRRGNRRGGYFSTLLPWEVARVPDESAAQTVQPTGDAIMRRIL